MQSEWLQVASNGLKNGKVFCSSISAAVRHRGGCVARARAGGSLLYLHYHARVSADRAHRHRNNSGPDERLRCLYRHKLNRGDG